MAADAISEKMARWRPAPERLVHDGDRRRMQHLRSLGLWRWLVRGASVVRCNRAVVLAAVVLVVFGSYGGVALGASWTVESTPKPTGTLGADLLGASCTSSTACTATGESVKGADGVSLAERWDGTSWTVQGTPNPSGAQESSLNGVSCTTSSACSAVGSSIGSGGVPVPLAEAWNGSGWTVQSTPTPAGAQESELKGVSCTSSTACTAVGDSAEFTSNGRVQSALVERWDGSGWTIQSTPSPTGQPDRDNVGLNGVSCTSATACAAVGSYTNTGGVQVTLGEVWNGASWAIQSTPSPSGAQKSELNGVSCTSSAACTATGDYTNSAGVRVTLAEVWDGSAWVIQSTPNPTGAKDSVLKGVSCTTGTACTAVGFYADSAGGYMTLAESWNGTSWSDKATPNPSGAQASGLYGVSCSSGTACTAAGSASNRAGTDLSLAEAGNGTTWAIQNTPILTGTKQSSLHGVSCTTGAACTAVGSVEGDGAATLVERWDGTSWTIQTSPNPAGRLIVLEGVSCTTSSACTAVGYYTNSAGVRVPLAEAWNGSGWTIQSTPDPSGARASGLNAVSCTSSVACTAVGSYTDSTGSTVTLAERWNGSTWTIQSTPNATSAPETVLSGVSCVSGTACTAVGHFLIGGSRFTVAETWNGTSWTIQDTPNPSGANESYFYGVSCTSSTACIAVGYFIDTNSSSTVSLAERWNGSSWTIQAVPSPSGGTGPYFYGVSCSSSSACAAGGQYRNSAGTEVTLAERWNGTGWTVQSTPNPSGGQNNSLSGVSCTANTACIAVGSYSTSAGGSAPLAEGLNPSWSVKVTPSPTGAQTSTLQAVSCAAGTGCTAVGFDRNSVGVPVTLAERWNGTNWTIQSTPNPAGAKESYSYGVSCPSAAACTAVGYYTNSAGVPMTLAEVWNGSSWSVQSTPDPAGATASVLNGVSCTSSSACTAVGIYVNSAGTIMTLAERWNGSSWTIQNIPDPTGAQKSFLKGLSCTTSSACTATGYYTNSAGTSVTLAERWNGISWTIQSTPNPSGAQNSALNGVSCTTGSACTAAGYYTNSAGTIVTLAERWDGSSWTIQNTPNPTGAKDSALNGVSCTISTACTAAGEYHNSAGVQLTLAERWNGSSWTIQSTPNPSGAKASGLNGVSCTTSTACTAAGVYTNSAAVTVTLAEDFS